MSASGSKSPRDTDPFDRNIDVHIARISRKVESDSAKT
jgi:DNA-binding response OmpR family regulator